MKTNKAICIQDYTFEDAGKSMTVKRGVEYRISEPDEDGFVQVFTSPLWGWAPATHFAGIVAAT